MRGLIWGLESDLGSEKPDLETERSDLGSERPDLGSERADSVCERAERPDLGSERPDLGSERPDLGSGRPDCGSKGPDLGSGRPDCGSEGPDLGSGRPILRLRGGGGRMDRWTDGQTDGRKPEKIAQCGIIGHRPPRGHCPQTTKKAEFIKTILMDGPDRLTAQHLVHAT